MGAKKILFPLEMRDGEKVHTLEELKEKFDISRVLEYANSGQLVKWLRDREAADMAAKIDSLDNQSEEYAVGVCEAVLGEVCEELLRQIKEIKVQKEEDGKRAAEQLRIAEEQAKEERRKAEEQKKQPPTILVNEQGIYLVEGDRVIPRKIAVINGRYSRDFYKDNGVVQEGKYAYYLKNTSKEDMKPINFLGRIDLETGEEKILCKMEESTDRCLFGLVANGRGLGHLGGIRNHKLFFLQSSSDEDFLILEIDLDSMKKISHKLENDPRPLYTRVGGISFSSRSIKPCMEDWLHIDESGKHIYCCMREDKKHYIADIDLEEDKVITIASLKGEHDWGYMNRGVGKYGFIMCDGYTIGSKYAEGSCLYYNPQKKEMQQYDVLGNEIYKLQERHNQSRIELYCHDEKIYWLVQMGEYFGGPGLILMEYDVLTKESIERVRLKAPDVRGYFTIQQRGLFIDEIFVSNNYLYLNP